MNAETRADEQRALLISHTSNVTDICSISAPHLFFCRTVQLLTESWTINHFAKGCTLLCITETIPHARGNEIYQLHELGKQDSGLKHLESSCWSITWLYLLHIPKKLNSTLYWLETYSRTLETAKSYSENSWKHWDIYWAEAVQETLNFSKTLWGQQIS